MKKLTITGVSCGEYECFDNDTKQIRFTAQFTDGIIIIYNYITKTESLKFFSMLSTGLSSSYIHTGNWPTDTNQQARQEMVTDWITNNKNRYKLLKN